MNIPTYEEALHWARYGKINGSIKEWPIEDQEKFKIFYDKYSLYLLSDDATEFMNKIYKETK